jgi:hypothetical protein
MKSRVSFVFWLAVAAFMLLPHPAFATACNASGCWSALVEVIRVSDDGKIWFVVDDSEALEILAPADCTVRSIWTGQAEKALFISTDDPSRIEKYKVLLDSRTLSQRISFGPALDPASGWCRLGQVQIGTS